MVQVQVCWSQNIKLVIHILKILSWLSLTYLWSHFRYPRLLLEVFCRHLLYFSKRSFPHIVMLIPRLQDPTYLHPCLDQSRLLDHYLRFRSSIPSSCSGIFGNFAMCLATRLCVLLLIISIRIVTANAPNFHSSWMNLKSYRLDTLRIEEVEFVWARHSFAPHWNARW